MSVENVENVEVKKSRRGFAAMDPEKQKSIAKAGGRAAHAKGTAHKFTSEEASAAGKKGGQKASQRRAEARAKSEEGKTT